MIREIKLVPCAACGGMMIEKAKPKTPKQADLLEAGLSCRGKLDEPVDGYKEKKECCS